MKSVISAMAATFALWGCSNEVVYHPHVGPPPSAGQPEKRDDGGPSGPAAEIVRQVGDADYAVYGIPLYPGARVDPRLNLSGSAAEKSGKQVHLTLKSGDDVESITVWYKNQVKATQAYLSRGGHGVDLGSLEGMTGTGYHISVTVARIETDSMITIAVDKTPAK